MHTRMYWGLDAFNSFFAERSKNCRMLSWFPSLSPLLSLVRSVYRTYLSRSTPAYSSTDLLAELLVWHEHDHVREHGPAAGVSCNKKEKPPMNTSKTKR